MFAAWPGDVVFSRIDARNGAIGVLQESIARAVVTTEFPVFVPVPDRLDGGFVKLVLRTGHFLAALRRKASGTSGRKRITPDAFADLRIPLPPLDEQRAIVAAHRAALDRAADLEREADEAEARAMEAFETALGFGPPAPLPERPVFIASFKHLDRWSHEGILRATLAPGEKGIEIPNRRAGHGGKGQLRTSKISRQPPRNAPAPLSACRQRAAVAARPCGDKDDRRT